MITLSSESPDNPWVTEVIISMNYDLMQYIHKPLLEEDDVTHTTVLDY